MKDLARALGIQCYVFNCSDQMDYQTMAQIYKGIAQTGVPCFGGGVVCACANGAIGVRLPAWKP